MTKWEMAQRNLRELHSHFLARTDRLLDEFLIVPPAPPTTVGTIDSDKLIENSRGFLVNRLFHIWGEFCMSLVVASAIGGYRTLKGVLINNAPGIRHVSDIPSVINERSIVGPRIHWEDPTWTASKVSLLRPANQHQITLGITAVPFLDFRSVRHFVVHPNSHTKVGFESVTRKHSLFRVGPYDLLLHRLPGGSTVLEGWVREFQIAAHTAVQ